MELTKEQIQEIDNYISVCGIKFYDVKAEIVDHFASILEIRLENESNLNFKEAIIEEHKKFSDKGFNNLLTTKTNTVHKRFFKSTLTNLKTFFKLPKIIITIGLFFILREVMTLFQNKEDFFSLLSGIGIFIMFQLTVRVLRYYSIKKERFLILESTNLFLQVINFVFIFFNTSITFRSDNSFNDIGYNLIHLAFFVILLLFYWSGEYIHQQNKKMIHQQYPNIIV
ncbi:MAG: hypothetical protein ACPGU6_06945 [Tenacibaculum sp.]